MTLSLSVAQIIERCTVTLVVTGAVSMPQYIDVVVDGKAYGSLCTPGTAYTFTHTLALERGPHIIYGQVWTDSAGTVTTTPITYVVAYELTAYGIDLYSGDALLDAIEPVLHDELLPALPTLNFSCATLLTGTIQAVIRERGLRQYQFTIATVAVSGGIYSYVCKAAETYVLTTAIMALQTAYGSTSDAIKLLIPSLNIINADVPTHSTVDLISNGGFEAGIAGWQGYGGSTVTRTTVSPLVGTASLKMVSAGGGYTAYQSHTVLIVGHQYYIAGLVKSTATAGRKVSILNFGGTVASVPVDCSASAQTVSGTLTATTAMMNEFAFQFDGYTAGDYFLLDAVVCYDLTPVTNVNLLAQTTYPQLFGKITPLDVIKQLMIQALVQASVRNGNLYVFPLDVSAQTPDYYMQRLDPLTGWQRDADVYNAVIAHYVVKQFPTPATTLTLNDKVNWKDANGANVLVYDVTQVSDSLLPAPSGALGMLKSVGNCSRAVSTLFRYFDRIRFNWLPVTAAYVDISLQQDAYNKLDLRHTWAGQSGSGFSLQGAPGVSTDTLTKDISCDDTGGGGTATKFVTTVTGTMTANCSYRVTLLDAGGATLWQDVWSYTIGSDNAFSAHVPTTVSRIHQATTVRIEFTDLYLIAGNYGVQCITCDITIQTWINIDSHQQVVSNVQYAVKPGNDFYGGGNRITPTIICPVPTLTESQTYTATVQSAVTSYQLITPFSGHVIDLGGSIYVSEGNLMWYVAFGPDPNMNITSWSSYSNIIVNVAISETVQDWLWSPSPFVWSPAFNLFESVDIPFSGMIRTGSPANLNAIVLTFSGDNYVDTLCLVADNPLPVTVRAGTGSRAYVVTDDFGSQTGAQAYADGLLPIVSVAREQYTRDVSLATDLGVGDTISGDGVNMTVYAVDYRQDGKTLAAGKAMDTLMTRLAEQARRLGTLERKGA